MNEPTLTLRDRLRMTLTGLRRHLKRLSLKRLKQEEEHREAAKAVWYSQIADSLQALHTPVPRGTSSINIQNIHTQTAETVALNQKLDLRENIALLYKKARKAARGLEIGEAKVAETNKEIESVQETISAAETALADQDEVRMTAAAGKAESLLAPHTSQNASPPTPHNAAKTSYRHYTLEGWDIYIGKNDDQNDELTTRFTRPNDLWLHVAGHAGSHVVIKRPRRGEEVPPAVVRTAAGFAVWFSKAKHTSYAEVHVTEGRFVRKRRHAPAGEVIAERCKNIRTSPISPQQLFPGKYA